MSRRTSPLVLVASLGAASLLSACGDNNAGEVAGAVAGDPAADPGEEDTPPDEQASARLLIVVTDEAGAAIDRALITIPQVEATLLRRSPVDRAAHNETRSEPGPLRTDSAGRLLLEELIPGRLVARVEAPGYAPASIVVDLPAGARTRGVARLMRMPSPHKFSAEAGASLREGAVKVDIPAGGVVDMDGEPVTGEVSATIVALDPSKGLRTMPGPLDARDATGVEVSLETFFMGEVSLWQGDRPLQLAPGATATLEMTLPTTYAGRPIGERIGEGDQIPAWWFDLDAGIWREEGFGEVILDQESGELRWRAEVAHFTWWNADQPIVEHSCLAISVLDGDGNPVPNVTVLADGVGYEGTSQLVTNAKGEGCLAIMIGEAAEVYVADIEGKPVSEPLLVQAKNVWGACNGQGETCQDVVIKFGAGKGPVCDIGDFEACPYTGPNGSENLGECTAGANFCVDGFSWTGCDGETLPTPEVCDPPGLDENCDGVVDNCAMAKCDPKDPDQAMIDCYGDPGGDPQPGLGVGVCKYGVLICDPVTKVYGNECVGDVLPGAEVCDSAEDEDCDGNQGCGDPLDAVHDAAKFESGALDIAAHAGGDIYVLGRARGGVDLGAGKQLTFAADDLQAHVFLARLAADLSPLWVRDLGAEMSGEVELAVTSDGLPIIAGTHSAAIDLGNACKIDAQALEGVFWARFTDSPNTPADCTLSGRVATWTPTVFSGISLATTAQQGFVIGGGFAGELEANGQHYPHLDGGAFVTRLNKDGGTVFLHGIDTRLAQNKALKPAIAVADDNTIYMQAAYASGAEGLPATDGLTEVFWRQVSPAGLEVWTRQLDLGAFDSLLGGAAIAVGPDGAPVFIGAIDGTAQVTNTSHSFGVVGQVTTYIAKASSEGDILWSHSLPLNLQGGAPEFAAVAPRVAVDAANRVALTGGFTGLFMFDGKLVNSAGIQDILALKFNPANGDLFWLGPAGGEGADYATCASYDSQGRVLVGGSFTGKTLEFNGEVIPNGAPGSSRAVVLRWQP